MNRTEQSKSRADREAKNKQQDFSAQAPVLKLRQLIIGIVCVVLFISLPMVMVWKQIYIRNVSVKESALADSCIVLSREAAGLRLYNERLANVQRIETIAKTALCLDYPTSEQIVLVKERACDGAAPHARQGFMAFFRKTFSRERG